MKTHFTLFCLAFAFCTSVSTTTKAQVDVQDSLALVDLYNSTDGPNWTDNTNWLTTKPVSEWYGISVSGNRVVAISLPYIGLSGNIPPELGNLTKLEILELSVNQLSGSIPPELGNLTGVNLLRLGNNQLSGSIPPEIGKLTNVKNLHLGTNQLSGSIPPEIGNLTNLVVLWLHNNQLSGSIPPEIGKLTNVNNLHLENNQLSGSIPPEIGNLTNLGSLWLNHNQLSGSIPPEIGKLTNLVYYLYLSYNQLSGNIPPSIGNLKSLLRLDISHNKLRGEIPVSFRQLRDEIQINLSHNRLTQKVNVVLPGARQRDNVLLDLTYNRFTFNGLEFAAQKIPNTNYTNQATITIHQNNNGLSISAGGTLTNNTYKWFNVDLTESTIITGDSTFQPAQSGQYYVHVTNAIATKLTLYSDTIDYVMPLAKSKKTFFAGNAEYKTANNKLLVYPNPAKDILNIKTKSNVSFSLLNQAGEIILTENITNKGSINISRIAAGVYYLRNNNTDAVEKIFIIR